MTLIQEDKMVDIRDSLNTDPECFMIMAGKKATVDGSVLIGHDDDLLGHNAAILEKIPRKQNGPDAVVNFPNGLSIREAEMTYECLILKASRGFDEGDAIAINEHQVSIAGGVALEKDRNEKAREVDPVRKKGVTGLARYVALQRTRSARECVEALGGLYSKYGVAYCSGVAVADPKEIWYIEAGGGRSWAAVRIPDECYWPQANGFRIGKIYPNDRENYLCSKGLLDFARDKGLWNPEEGPFHFARAFGGKRDRTPGQEYFNSRRVWGCLRILSPSMDLDPYSLEFPVYTVPDSKIGVKDLFSALRDHYEGTEFDVINNPSVARNVRPIAVANCVHTDVVQLRSWFPPSIGGVLWAGLSSPSMTPYIPYYSGIDFVPRAYRLGGEFYDPSSAFWIYRTVATLVNPYHKKLIGDVLPRWQKIEEDALSLQPYVDRTASDLYKQDKVLASRYLTTYSNGLAHIALETARRIVAQLHTTIAEKGHLWE